MHTSFYAGLLAFFYFYISFEVIKQRKIHKVAYGYGKGELAGYVAAHGNFTSYTPMFLILLFFAEEIANLPEFAIHLIGAFFLVGRCFHFMGLTRKEHLEKPIFKYRVIGMMITFICFLLLASIVLTRSLSSILFQLQILS